MSNMYGADVAQLRDLASAFDQAAQRLDAGRMAVGNRIRLRFWLGPIAVRFRLEWDSQYSRMIHSAAEGLRLAARDARTNADEQDRTSAADGAIGTSAYAPYPRPTDVRVSRIKEIQDDPPRGASDPAQIIREFGRDGAYESGVSIRTIVYPDGRRAYIVYVPGTQDWFGSSGNVYDGIDNIPAALQLDTKATRAILEAMRQQGIGPDDPVMLAGHSQGAMLAANLAASDGFRASYNVQGVLAYGADISDRSIPSTVAVTQVTNSADIVPRVTSPGIGGGVENLNRISFDYVSLRTAHEHDESILGRFANAGEALWNVITSPVGEHVSNEDYANNTYGWYSQHRSEWNREYSSFLTGDGVTSSVTRYSFGE